MVTEYNNQKKNFEILQYHIVKSLFGTLLDFRKRGEKGRKTHAKSDSAVSCILDNIFSATICIFVSGRKWNTCEDNVIDTVLSDYFPFGHTKAVTSRPSASILQIFL